MFKLFKKKEEVQLVTLPVAVIENPNNYPQEVLEIHKEFHCAADLLLAEANEIISQASTKDVKKVSRLENLGFKQASQVAELKPLLQKAELSKEQLELLKYYSFTYPNNKFITEEQVKTICFKYNLVCGDVGRFKGFVPEKNLQDIERFKVKDRDKLWEYRYGSTWFTDEQAKIPNTYDQGGWYAHDYSSFEPSIKAGVPDGNKTRYAETSFHICAPIKDMDITGYNIKDGYKMEKHIPDPVVLQPVRGGYLIVTAWGDEASDELVVNQKFN